MEKRKNKKWKQVWCWSSGIIDTDEFVSVFNAASPSSVDFASKYILGISGDTIFKKVGF